jgi:hypothetical protein
LQEAEDKVSAGREIHVVDSICPQQITYGFPGVRTAYRSCSCYGKETEYQVPLLQSVDTAAALAVRAIYGGRVRTEVRVRIQYFRGHTR